MGRIAIRDQGRLPDRLAETSRMANENVCLKKIIQFKIEAISEDGIRICKEEVNARGSSLQMGYKLVAKMILPESTLSALRIILGIDGPVPPQEWLQELLSTNIAGYDQLIQLISDHRLRYRLEGNFYN